MYSASSIIWTSIICTLTYPDTRATASFSGKSHIVHKHGASNGCHANF